MSALSNEDLRAFARSLFAQADTDSDTEQHAQRPGNTAPREGQPVASPEPNAMLPFVRSLFGRNPDE